MLKSEKYAKQNSQSQRFLFLVFTSRCYLFYLLQRVEIVPMQYGKGGNAEADLFWESLAHKTWSWRLEVSEPQDLRVVIKAAIYRGRGKKCLRVNSLQPA